jgi:hypothetical protein
MSEWTDTTVRFSASWMLFTKRCCSAVMSEKGNVIVGCALNGHIPCSLMAHCTGFLSIMVTVVVTGSIYVEEHVLLKCVMMRCRETPLKNISMNLPRNTSWVVVILSDTTKCGHVGGSGIVGRT